MDNDRNVLLCKGRAKMRISVLLPGPALKPVGGYKIIYNYLYYLKKFNKNFEINIFYPSINILLYNKETLKDKLKRYYIKFFDRKFYKWSSIKNEDVKHYLSIDLKKLSNSDILIATSVETAIFIKRFGLDKGKQVLYFIQHFEDWNVSKEKVIETYHYGFKNIVVSKWLKTILEKNQAPVSLYLPNPVDDDFIYKTPIEHRYLKSVLFLYHKSIWKGSYEALQAFEKLYKYDNNFIISCFSTFNKPKNFPPFINFYKNPPKEKLIELYNSHTFFVSSSYSEGYGLPPAEAMACGCCVITTKSGGVEDFAIHNETAYMIPSPPNPDEIVDAILNLLKDKNKIFNLSKKGREQIKKFSWRTNTKKLLELINE
jgi:glycosyltransferase involved in cell wall biosynthesis